MSSVDELAKRGGEHFYEKFNRARVVLIFLLGCALIIYSVIDNATNLAYIIVGAVLVGLVPVDQWLMRMLYQPRVERDRTGPKGQVSASK
jgi:hypothetical protein